MKESFEPIIDKNCRLLILGTMPGEESLRKQEYYGNRMNRFWDIIYALFDENPTTNYEKKKAFVLKKSIGVWDVLKSCDREGSSDTNIKNPAVNDFEGLFEAYPNISDVFFNGQNAEKFFKKFTKGKPFVRNLSFHVLPSTSPANNTISFQNKLESWKAICAALNAKSQDGF